MFKFVIELLTSLFPDEDLLSYREIILETSNSSTANRDIDFILAHYSHLWSLRNNFFIGFTDMREEPIELRWNITSS